MTTTAKGNLRPSLKAGPSQSAVADCDTPLPKWGLPDFGGRSSAEDEGCGGCRNRPAGESPHSNPWTGGESQPGFALDAGLGGTTKTLCAVACFSSALLERATAERCAILPR